MTTSVITRASATRRSALLQTLPVICLLGIGFAGGAHAEPGRLIGKVVSDAPSNVASQGGNRDQSGGTEPVSQQSLSNPNDYWTPERLRDATGLPLPEGDPRELGPMYMPEPLSLDQSTQSAPSAPPSQLIEPDLGNQLFEPEQEEPSDGMAPLADIMPQAMAPSGALYTNSRVFPAAALTAYPYSATGKLYFRDPVSGGTAHCSASVIQRRLIATAGHCVYNAVDGYWYTDFVFVPAYHNGAAPFGTWTWRQVFTTGSWYNGGARLPNPGDFAILVARNKGIDGKRVSVGELVGWLGWQTDYAANSHVTILGYPGNLDRGERLQQTSTQTFAVAEPNAAEFGSGHGPGSSGGPYVMNFGRPAEGQFEDLYNRLVGIMSYGRVDLSQQMVGTSIINGEFASLFDAACKSAPGACG